MSNEQLSERHVQDAFHSYLKSSLTQAKIERLLDADVLSSAEGDLMITGPALCLYFAALRCTTNPPSVPLPRSNKSSQPMDLSPTNCPPAFLSFLRLWANTVHPIQSLPPEQQHDLARVICGLEPLSQPSNPAINGIAADLRAVAIEISQRRSFQDRYASDLQAALDSGGGPSSPGVKKASFVPPPLYDPSPSSSANSSPLPSPNSQLPPPSPQYANHNLPPQNPSNLSPYGPGTAGSSSSSTRDSSPSPTILTAESPAIEFIRETLYASLGDVLETYPSLQRLLKADPTRAYFAAVAFAILHVCATSITPDGVGVRGILGTTLTAGEVPLELRPFMSELLSVAKQAKEIEVEDDEIAMKCAVEGREPPDAPRMERARTMLLEGVGYQFSQNGHDDDGRRRSLEGRAVAFVNRVNALALGMTRLSTFRERQDDVFKVLSGIS
ncbi:hypothetical protein HGRIS_004556 [Hohenbuehelia grisea]|uniref:CCR4-NOT transcription complex subunit 11 n=1 Tax=Hohenbuehelia grisea TaxID=104357 RepID=A0ABR3JCG6_9AGAR